MGILRQKRGPAKPTEWRRLALATVLRYATPAGQGKTKPAPQPGLSGVHFKQSTGSLLLRLAGSLFRAIYNVHNRPSAAVRCLRSAAVWKAAVLLNQPEGQFTQLRHTGHRAAHEPDFRIFMEVCRTRTMACRSWGLTEP